MIRKFLTKYDLRLFVLVVAIFVCFANVPGTFEGKQFPVIEDMAIHVMPVTEGRSEIFLDFKKIRNCSYRKIEFYMNDMNGDAVLNAKISAHYLGPVEVKWSGRQYTGVGPYAVYADAAKLQNLTVIAYHRCHGAYNTITKYRLADGQVTRLQGAFYSLCDPIRQGRVLQMKQLWLLGKLWG